MTYTVIINIAGRGTLLANGTSSETGHMWYSLNDGSGNDPVSYGFGPIHDDNPWNNPFGPGEVYKDDSTNYQTRDYVKIVEITKEQYDAMKNFGDNPDSAKFSTLYNGLGNSCIDFTWAALKAGGLTDGYQGNVWPSWNADDVDAALRASNGLFDDLLRTVFNPAVAQTIADTFTSAARWVQPFVGGRDPLTFDLNGNGIETVSINSANPILFDHTGSGVKAGTGWIAPGDGFLVLDRNGNGTIDNGTELFGDSTPLATGGNAADGFAALAAQDTNADGVVNSLDANFANLRIWQDLNQDGISFVDANGNGVLDAGETSELKTLAELNIASIKVAKIENSQMLANGNEIADLGSYTLTDGSMGGMGITSGLADVNLAADTFHRMFLDSVPLDSLAATLPDMQGSGVVTTLSSAERGPTCCPAVQVTTPSWLKAAIPPMTASRATTATTSSRVVQATT